MVVRGANYPRKPNEFYATPPETTRVMLTTVQFLPSGVCDPAQGDGAIRAVLREYGYVNKGGDIIADGYDFLTDKFRWPGCDIVTNPPFGPGGRTACLFIRRALQVTQQHRGKFAMLLPVDFDSGSTRVELFRDCPAFALKLVLLNRIRWFNGQSGSTNHAWFVWSWHHTGAPRIKYKAQEYGD
jgi:hypothetical protein